jgi:hypothetical protein
VLSTFNWILFETSALVFPLYWILRNPTGSRSHPNESSISWEVELCHYLVAVKARFICIFVCGFMLFYLSICYRLYAHKIYPRIVIPIGALFQSPHMRNLPKWPVLVILVPVRALSGANFLSVRELTENENNWQKMKISFSAIKKETHKFANWDPN